MSVAIESNEVEMRLWVRYLEISPLLREIIKHFSANCQAGLHTAHPQIIRNIISLLSDWCFPVKVRSVGKLGKERPLAKCKKRA